MCVQARMGGIRLQTSIYSNLLMDFDLGNVTANQVIAFIMRCYMYIDIYIGYYVIRHFSLIFSLSQAVISSYATERVTSSNYIWKPEMIDCCLLLIYRVISTHAETHTRPVARLRARGSQVRIWRQVILRRVLWNTNIERSAKRHGIWSYSGALVVDTTFERKWLLSA